MTCIPIVGNPSFYGVCRKFSDYAPGTISNPWGSKDRKMIIGAETFNDSRCEENPKTFREFRNSIGKCTAWDSSSTVSNNLYSTDSPGSRATRTVLIARVLSFMGAKMHLSESQAIFLKLKVNLDIRWIPVHLCCIQKLLYFQVNELYQGWCLSDTYHHR